MRSDYTNVLNIVTGANSGIGFETAKLFATSSDSHHIFMACRSLEKGEKALSDIKATDTKSILSLVQLEVTNDASVRKAAELVATQTSHIDFLINNAGAHSATTDLGAQLREVFAVNTAGPAVITEAFKPLLAKSKNPRVIFLSSSVGSISLRCDPTNKSYNGSAIAYRVSKAGLNMLTACYAKELGEQMGCKVWAVDPGLVATNLTGNAELLRARGAGDPAVAAGLIVDTCNGLRDGDVGKLIYKDGVYNW